MPDRDSRGIGSEERRRAPDNVAIIGLAERWLPYGGPDSFETLVSFGLPPEAFADRLLDALDSDGARDSEISAETEQGLRRYAHRWSRRE
ncbi:hypothetical protein GCM10009619_15540 [Williamsia maris]|uniref:DUF3263 domain-containing protein n=1 Tax=Williamsia maris TaxID=72806 RepID=A0ABT1HDG5_9NOCA|nr:hypothetical protein [Williamsia maris]